MSIQIALISPYHGGSHQDWARGYITHSRNEIRLFSMPARFWKWRMHGAAITLARRIHESGFDPDVILTTDMLDLSTFLALSRGQLAGKPIILYMHENQLTYPLPRDPNMGSMRRQRGERDLHYAFINYTSMLTADRVIFNSEYHRETLLKALIRYLRGFPEFNEQENVKTIASKSLVLYPGINVQLDPKTSTRNLSSPPLIIWNQRWEYDKDPKSMLEALFELAGKNLPFEVAICGQNFRVNPVEFDAAREILKNRIVHFGFAEPNTYRRLLQRAEITLSTAVHEFFGISIVEAMAFRVFPILPNRLSYPEILPSQFHEDCLYSDSRELSEKLEWAMKNLEMIESIAKRLSDYTQRFRWTILASEYDRIVESLVDEA